jgi:hypothetical protein
MVVFMATIAHVYIRRFLEKKKFDLSCTAAFNILNKHVTLVYDNKNYHLPAIPSPAARKIYEVFNIVIPKKLFIR